MNRTVINMLKTLPITFKSNWKNHIKNRHLHITTQNITVHIFAMFLWTLTSRFNV